MTSEIANLIQTSWQGITMLIGLIAFCIRVDRRIGKIETMLIQHMKYDHRSEPK